MQTATYPSHAIHLDLLTGVGLVVRPPVELETFGVRLEWSQLMRELDGEGWEPVTDDDGLPVVEGWTGNGCEVVMVSHADPITSNPPLELVVSATAELHRLAGVAVLN